MYNNFSPPSNQVRIKKYLQLLSKNPPYVLLLEGGNLADRNVLGLYWVALLNCKDKNETPCLECEICRNIDLGIFRDLYVLDGHKESIKIEQAREVRRLMGQMPEYRGHRVFVIQEAQELTLSAANALLKSLEEPLPRNVFVLLTPHRSRLLPTLVSRSYIFTLNWNSNRQEENTLVQEWKKRFLCFWQTEQGLFEYTCKKGELDQKTVQEIITSCQSELLEAFSGEANTELSRYLKQHFDSTLLSKMDNLLSKGFEALYYQVNPSLVVDWIALQVWSWLQ